MKKTIWKDYVTYSTEMHKVKHYIADFLCQEENELIKVLPPMKERNHYFSFIENLPPVDANIRKLNAAERIQKLEDLFLFRVAREFGYIVDVQIAQAMRKGYRSARKNEDIQISDQNVSESMFYRKQGGNTTAFTLIGPSGVGKTTTLEDSLSYYPQRITHYKQNSKMNQITYIKVECPAAGSMKSFYESCLDEMEKALDYEIPSRKQCRTVDAKKQLFVKCAARWNLGLLVIDEIQNLLYLKKNSKLLMNQFLNLSNEIHVPIVYVGTDMVQEFYENSEFYLKRRLGVEIRVKPYDNDSIWEDFLEKMWEYQYMQEYVPLTAEMKTVFYKETGGIIDRVIMLYKTAQEIAIINRRDRVETFNAAFIQAISKDSFSLTRDSLQILADAENKQHGIMEKDLKLSVADKKINREIKMEKAFLVEHNKKDEQLKKLICKSRILSSVNVVIANLPYTFNDNEIEQALFKLSGNQLDLLEINTAAIP